MRFYLGILGHVALMFLVLCGVTLSMMFQWVVNPAWYAAAGLALAAWAIWILARIARRLLPNRSNSTGADAAR